MMKARRKIPMEPSPSAPTYRTVRERRASFGYRSLLQDYEDLLKVVRAKRRKLQRIRLKKKGLLSEIRFLRRKHRSLSGKSLQETVYIIRKQSNKSCVPTTCVHHVQSSTFRVPGEGPSEPKNLKLGAANTSAATILLDLNQGLHYQLHNDEEGELRLERELDRLRIRKA